MTGRIIKAISGFYYVYIVESGLYECKAKGAFRHEKQKPLVGDFVEISVVDEEKKLGNVESIMPRSSQLIRPEVANVDQALVIFAAKSPDPNLNLLDRFLAMMEYNKLEAVIVFNKVDLVEEDELRTLTDIYNSIGYRTLVTCAKEGKGVNELRQLLNGKTTCVAGPSGVGKSSLVNALYEKEIMETGELSEKISRGKNTTRHSQLVYLGEDTYICDTPGFSSFYTPDMELTEYYKLFREFVEYEPNCRFAGCSHIAERDCGIKEALSLGKISQSRYDNYVQIYEEMKGNKKY